MICKGAEVAKPNYPVASRIPYHEEELERGVILEKGSCEGRGIQLRNVGEREALGEDKC